MSKKDTMSDMQADKDFAAFDDFDIDASNTKRGDVALPSKIKSDWLPSIKGGFLEGLKSEISSKLPNASGAYSFVASTYNEFKSMTSDFVTEATPIVRSIGRSTNRLMPIVKPFMPSSLYDKITGKLGAIPDEDQEMSEEEKQTQQIGADVNAALQTSDAKADVRSKMQNVVDSIRHKAILGSMGSLSNQIANVTSFLSTTLTAYMKKDLELQYRQLYTQKNIAESLRATAKLLEVELKNITHNTGLPDLKKAESFKNRTTKLETLSEYGHKFFGRMLENAKNNIFGQIKSALGMMSDAAEMADQGREMQEAMGQKLTAGNLITNLLLNTVGKAVGTKFGNRLIKTLSPFAGGLENGFQNWGNDLVRGLHRYSKKDGILSGLLRIFLPGEYSTSYNVENVAATDPNKPISFDISTKEAIVTVIPGFLSKIHKSVELIRSPEGGAEELIYNTRSRSFITRSQNAKAFNKDGQIDRLFNLDNANPTNRLIDLVVSGNAVVGGVSGSEIANWFNEADDEGTTNMGKLKRLFINIATSDEYEREFKPDALTIGSRSDSDDEAAEYFKMATFGIKDPDKLVDRIIAILSDGKGGFNQTLINNFQTAIDGLANYTNATEFVNRTNRSLNDSTVEGREALLADLAERKGRNKDNKMVSIYDTVKGAFDKEALNDYLARSNKGATRDLSVEDMQKNVSTNENAFSFGRGLEYALGYVGGELDVIGGAMKKAWGDGYQSIREVIKTVRSELRSILPKSLVKTLSATVAILYRDIDPVLLTFDTLLASDQISEKDRKIITAYVKSVITSNGDMSADGYAKLQKMTYDSLENPTLKRVFLAVSSDIKSQKDAINCFGTIRERIEALRKDPNYSALESSVFKLPKVLKEKFEGVFGSFKRGVYNVSDSAIAILRGDADNPSGDKSGRQSTSIDDIMRQYPNYTYEEASRLVEQRKKHNEEITKREEAAKASASKAMATDADLSEFDARTMANIANGTDKTIAPSTTAGQAGAAVDSAKNMSADATADAVAELAAKILKESKGISPEDAMRVAKDIIAGNKPKNNLAPRLHHVYNKFLKVKDSILSKSKAAFEGIKTTLGIGSTPVSVLPIISQLDKIFLTLTTTGTSVDKISKILSKKLGDLSDKEIADMRTEETVRVKEYRRSKKEAVKDFLNKGMKTIGGVFSKLNPFRPADTIASKYVLDSSEPESKFHSDFRRFFEYKKEMDVLMASYMKNNTIIGFAGNLLRGGGSAIAATARLMGVGASAMWKGLGLAVSTIPTGVGLLARGVGSAIGGIASPAWELTKFSLGYVKDKTVGAAKLAVKPITWLGRKVKDKFSKKNRWFDLYRKDRFKPGDPLCSVDVQKRCYTTDSSPKRLTSTFDIKGPILDSETNNTYLTKEDWEAGIVNIDGKSLFELSKIAGSGATWKDVLAGFTGVTGAVGNIIKKATDITGIFAGAGGMLLKGAAGVGLHALDFGISGLERLFGFNDMSVKRFEKKYKPMLSRFDTMIEYLKGIKENTTVAIKREGDNTDVDSLKYTEQAKDKEKKDASNPKPSEATTTAPSGGVLKTLGVIAGSLAILKEIVAPLKTFIANPIKTAVVYFEYGFLKNAINLIDSVMRGNEKMENGEIPREEVKETMSFMERVRKYGFLTATTGAISRGFDYTAKTVSGVLHFRKSADALSTAEKTLRAAKTKNAIKAGTDLVNDARKAKTGAKVAAEALQSLATTAFGKALVSFFKLDTMYAKLTNKLADLTVVLDNFILYLGSAKGTKPATTVGEWCTQVWPHILEWIKLANAATPKWMFKVARFLGWIAKGINWMVVTALKGASAIANWIGMVEIALDGYARSMVHRAAEMDDNPQWIDQYEKENGLTFGRVLESTIFAPNRNLLIGGSMAVYWLGATAISRWESGEMYKRNAEKAAANAELTAEAYTQKMRKKAKENNDEAFAVDLRKLRLDLDDAFDVNEDTNEEVRLDVATRKANYAAIRAKLFTNEFLNFENIREKFTEQLKKSTLSKHRNQRIAIDILKQLAYRVEADRFIPYINMLQKEYNQYSRRDYYDLYASDTRRGAVDEIFRGVFLDVWDKYILYVEGLARKQLITAKKAGTFITEGRSNSIIRLTDDEPATKNRNVTDSILPYIKKYNDQFDRGNTYTNASMLWNTTIKKYMHPNTYLETRDAVFFYIVTDSFIGKAEAEKDAVNVLNSMLWSGYKCLNYSNYESQTVLNNWVSESSDEFGDYGHYELVYVFKTPALKAQQAGAAKRAQRYGSKHPVPTSKDPISSIKDMVAKMFNFSPATGSTPKPVDSAITRSEVSTSTLTQASDSATSTNGSGTSITAPSPVTGSPSLATAAKVFKPSEYSELLKSIPSRYLRGTNANTYRLKIWSDYLAGHMTPNTSILCGSLVFFYIVASTPGSDANALASDISNKLIAVIKKDYGIADFSRIKSDFNMLTTNSVATESGPRLASVYTVSYHVLSAAKHSASKADASTLRPVTGGSASEAKADTPTSGAAAASAAATATSSSSAATSTVDTGVVSITAPAGDMVAVMMEQNKNICELMQALVDLQKKNNEIVSTSGSKQGAIEAVMTEALSKITNGQLDALTTLKNSIPPPQQSTATKVDVQQVVYS